VAARPRLPRPFRKKMPGSIVAPPACAASSKLDRALLRHPDRPRWFSRDYWQ